MERPVTIMDVAQAAGVSKSTVSRVLDERLPRSNSPTAQRVRKAALELGYHRDVSASNLRRGTTGTIGVIVPRLTDTAMAVFFEAVARACAQRQQLAIVATTGDELGRDRAAADELLRRRVDGLILTTSRADSEVPDELLRRGVPHVLALRSEGPSPAVVGDDELGGYLATRHLIDLGHQRIGLVGGPAYASSARSRHAGYRRALEEAGLGFDATLVRESGFTVESGHEVGLDLMNATNPPTAVFAVNDNLVIGVWSALASLGRWVPADVSIVGYNDIPISSRLPVPLSTVRVPFDDIAEAALDLLMRYERLERTPESARRVLSPTLIPRQSSGRVRSS